MRSSWRVANSSTGSPRRSRQGVKECACRAGSSITPSCRRTSRRMRRCGAPARPTAIRHRPGGWPLVGWCPNSSCAFRRRPRAGRISGPCCSPSWSIFHSTMESRRSSCGLRMQRACVRSSGDCCGNGLSRRRSSSRRQCDPVLSMCGQSRRESIVRNDASPRSGAGSTAHVQAGCPRTACLRVWAMPMRAAAIPQVFRSGSTWLLHGLVESACIACRSLREKATGRATWKSVMSRSMRPMVPAASRCILASGRASGSRLKSRR